jgi:hypothetical protein
LTLSAYKALGNAYVTVGLFSISERTLNPVKDGPDVFSSVVSKGFTSVTAGFTLGTAGS